MEGEIERSEVEAALAARRELGTEYDEAFVEQFAERIEQVVEARMAASTEPDESSGRQFELAVSSLGIGIPLTAVAGVFADLPGVIAAWVGIVGVNVAHSLSHRRRPR